MTDFIKVTTRGDEELVGLFKRIPAGSRKIAMTEFTKYVVGNDAHGLKHYAPEHPGSTYVRTFKLKGGWTYSVGDTRAYITNPIWYAPYPQGQPPAAHMAKLGWRGHMDVIFSNMTGGIRQATLAVIRWIKSQM